MAEIAVDAPAQEQAAAKGRAVPAGRVALAVLWKDLAVEWRSREIVGGMIVFALLLVLLLHFTLELDIQRRPSLTAGALWVALAFSGALGVGLSLAREVDRDSLDGLLLAPAGRTALYAGKTAANLVFLLLAAAVLLPATSLLYQVSLLRPTVLAAVGLGSLGYAAIGTLLSAMAVQARTREILLPVLLFPVLVPLLVAGAKATEGALAGLPWNEVVPWFHILVAFNGIFLSTAWLVFDSVVED